MKMEEKEAPLVFFPVNSLNSPTSGAAPRGAAWRYAPPATNATRSCVSARQRASGDARPDGHFGSSDGRRRAPLV